MTPLLHDLENGDIDFSDSGKPVDKISKLITHHPASHTDPSVVAAKRKNKCNVYVRLPEDVNPIPHGGGGADSALLQIVFFITSVRDAAEPQHLVTFPKI